MCVFVHVMFVCVSMRTFVFVCLCVCVCVCFCCLSLSLSLFVCLMYMYAGGQSNMTSPSTGRAGIDSVCQAWHQATYLLSHIAAHKYNNNIL